MLLLLYHLLLLGRKKTYLSPPYWDFFSLISSYKGIFIWMDLLDEGSFAVNVVWRAFALNSFVWGGICSFFGWSHSWGDAFLNNPQWRTISSLKSVLNIISFSLLWIEFSLSFPSTDFDVYSTFTVRLVSTYNIIKDIYIP